MKLTLLNGSPRGEKSNSQVMLKWLSDGYGEELPILNINTVQKHKAAILASLDADIIYMAIPLYFDSMPGQVMKFFEELSQYKVQLNGKKIGFLVHSGFPEGYHSYALRAVLESIADELGMEHLRTVIRGGSEGTRLMPENFQKKEAKAIRQIGKAIKSGHDIPDDVFDTLIKPIHMPKAKQISFKFF